MPGGHHVKSDSVADGCSRRVGCWNELDGVPGALREDPRSGAYIYCTKFASVVRVERGEKSSVIVRPSAKDHPDHHGCNANDGDSRPEHAVSTPHSHHGVGPDSGGLQPRLSQCLYAVSYSRVDRGDLARRAQWSTER